MIAYGEAWKAPFNSVRGDGNLTLSTKLMMETDLAMKKHALMLEAEEITK